MDNLVSLCKRRGFIFQSSEIYGGINGFWDYGPLGADLKRNIKDAWWRDTVHRRDDMVGLDSSIIMHPRIWEASGHVQGFTDPMVDCRACKRRYKADQIKVLRPSGGEGLSFAFFEGDREPADRKIRKQAKADPSAYEVIDLSALDGKDFASVVGPDVDEPGTLTEPRSFNLMFRTQVGPVADESSVAYLRPETAQGIFAQFSNVLATSRQKIPFGIAQIGKAFRNEINPRNFTFRSREFEQMEVEFFVKPGTDEDWHRTWIAERLRWYESIGIAGDHLHQFEYPKSDLAHYASACVDITYDFPFGRQELEGIAARGDFDLSRHQEYSGKSMVYFDEETREKFIPHVVEPSAGVDRICLAVLCEAYAEEWVPKGEGAGGPRPAEPGAPVPEFYEPRTVLRFHPRVAPVKAAVFPLLKNRPELVEKAREIYRDLQRRHRVFWDQTGAIGRRYRRQDEAGTPFGITIDFETLENGTVTLRDRDSMAQERIPAAEVAARIDPAAG